MNDLRLQTMFCKKLSDELELFKLRMLKQLPEDIYGSAYEIDCKVNIYELMVDKSLQIDSEMILHLLVVPDLLDQLFKAWMNVSDSAMTELDACLDTTIRKYSKHYPAPKQNKVKFLEALGLS